MDRPSPSGDGYGKTAPHTRRGQQSPILPLGDVCTSRGRFGKDSWAVSSGRPLAWAVHWRNALWWSGKPVPAEVQLWQRHQAVIADQRADRLVPGSRSAPLQKLMQGRGRPLATSAMHFPESSLVANTIGPLSWQRKEPRMRGSWRRDGTVEGKNVSVLPTREDNEGQGAVGEREGTRTERERHRKTRLVQVCPHQSTQRDSSFCLLSFAFILCRGR